VGGRRLYDIARSAGGVPDEVLAETAREIEVYDAELLGYRQVESGPLAGHQAALITVTCSSGTYVRELAEQAGRALGTPACLSFLVRTRTAGVALDDCVTMEQLLQMYGSPGWVRRHGAAWRSPSEAVGFLPAAVLDDAGVMRVVNSGAPVPRSAAVADAQVSIPKTLNDALAASGFTGYTRLLDRELNLLALARCEGSMYRPVKVLALAGERGMA
jgi:tRNA U55 pseudouridine synthase TruB